MYTKYKEILHIKEKKAAQFKVWIKDLSSHFMGGLPNNQQAYEKVLNFISH